MLTASGAAWLNRVGAKLLFCFRRAEITSSTRGGPGFMHVKHYCIGEDGIRTHGAVTRTPVFKTGPFSRSGTSPNNARQAEARVPAMSPGLTTPRRVRPANPHSLLGPRRACHIVFAAAPSARIAPGRSGMRPKGPRRLAQLRKRYGQARHCALATRLASAWLQRRRKRYSGGVQPQFPAARHAKNASISAASKAPSPVRSPL